MAITENVATVSANIPAQDTTAIKEKLEKNTAPEADGKENGTEASNKEQDKESPAADTEETKETTDEVSNLKFLLRLPSYWNPIPSPLSRGQLA